MSLLIGCFGIYACSGGTGPVGVEGPGPSPDEPNDGDIPVAVGNPFDIESGPSGPGPGATTGPGGGSGNCSTCADLLLGTAVDPPCPDAEAAAAALSQCAAAFCPTECQQFDATCQVCLEANCPTEFATCAGS